LCSGASFAADTIDVQEVQGHSGGIWLLQRRGCDYSFTPVSKMHQCVSVIVAKGNDKWLCSGVYASPIYTARPAVWEYLADLSDNNSLLWFVIGDFNDILSFIIKMQQLFGVSGGPSLSISSCVVHS
jgi:hypothetical protein